MTILKISYSRAYASRPNPNLARQLSQMPDLTELYCRKNLLENLDLSQNPCLIKLDCGWTELPNLDVSGLNRLEILQCNNNQLTQLDLSKNTSLKKLNCGHNQLTQLDLSSVVTLEDLNCSYNTQLETLVIPYEIINLDIEGCTNLKQIIKGSETIPLYFDDNNTAYKIISTEQPIQDNNIKMLKLEMPIIPKRRTQIRYVAISENTPLYTVPMDSYSDALWNLQDRIGKKITIHK